MLRSIKKALYFPFASYFAFFAFLKLKIWNPRVVVITGSSGKTTLLHLIESQLGERAKYSHQANSSFGVPFNILGLFRKDLTPLEWPFLFLSAPFKVFASLPREKIYVVEADCDRPFEGKFLSALLKPEVTLWVSVSRTHCVNFEGLIGGKFKSVEEIIAFEFGYFLENTKKIVLINGDSNLINSQIKRTKAEIIPIKKTNLKDYRVFKDSTDFKIGSQVFKFKALLPAEAYYSIEMTNRLLDYLEIKPKPYSNFTLPPGRSSYIKGVKNTTLIDSTYNNSLEGIETILDMFSSYPASKKWLVLGDILEQGDKEQEEHERLAKLLSSKNDLEKILLIGPRVSEYTFPKLKQKSKVLKFTLPKEVLDYLVGEIKGGEVILFKGARFLEGVIEHLLLDKSQVSLLPRREKVWQKRREQWGL